jgi:CspA family cold shock protein
MSRFRTFSPHGIAAEFLWQARAVGCGLFIDLRREEKERFVMAIGTVKWFNTQKGYGFIQPDDGSKDVFVHITAVEQAGIGHLNEGQKLSYELEAGRDGKSSAVNLQAK